jgi:hypothetical protein
LDLDRFHFGLNGVQPAYDSSDTSVSEAIDGVIIDHAHGLHEGLADGRPDEFEASAQQISAQGIRLRRARGNLLGRSPPVHPRCATDEAPHVGVKTPELALYRKEGLRIAHGTLDGVIPPVRPDGLMILPQSDGAFQMACAHCRASRRPLQ